MKPNDTSRDQGQDAAAQRWRLPLLAAALIAATFAAGAGSGPDRDPLTALAEGNELATAGELEQAVAAYRAGYDPQRPHPTLVYNLGTALHRLDRLPEAVLWYRRGPVNDDPWLQENLWLARRSLGSQQLPSGTFGRLASRAEPVAYAGIALAWLFLFLVTFAERWSRRLPATVALLALTLYASAFVLHRWGPRPAVLLADCAAGGAELPAGTEAWVRPAGDGWHVSGSRDTSCPAESVALVAPR